MLASASKKTRNGSTYHRAEVLRELVLREGGRLSFCAQPELDQRGTNSLGDVIPRVLAVLAEVVSAYAMINFVRAVPHNAIVEHDVELSDWGNV